MFEGKVMFFDSEIGFGFLETELGDVFFHKKYQGKFVCNGGNDPVLRTGLNDQSVEKDDLVLFDPEEGPKGLRARCWATKESHETALQEIANRETYRLVDNKTILGEPTGKEPVTLWEGVDINDLRANIKGALKRNYVFQVLKGDEWINIDYDPRKV